MKRLLLSYQISFLLNYFDLSNGIFFPNVYPRLELCAKPDGGNPLMLTPYLSAGKIALAQNLSRVTVTEERGFRSHAGFFTIDEKYNSNHYFWYFLPFSKNKFAPVLLWLQGGPGGSSMFGLFTEIGPLVVQKKGTITTRKYHWALDFHLIFIDNPVGAGFSFTKDAQGYCTNEECIGNGLYNSIQQFFLLFPHLRKNKFFITGESYAGKYIPSLAMKIHTENSIGILNKINLQGMAIGNAYIDPINQMDYGNYLYQHGLIDWNQYCLFETLQKQIAQEITNQNWANADIIMDKLMDGELTNFSYFKTYTGFSNYYDFLRPKDDLSMDDLKALLHDVHMRRAVHVGSLPFNSGEVVLAHMAMDLLKSVAPILAQLLSHYRVLLYNGQLDIVVAYPLTENFLRKLAFSSSSEYKSAQRQIWRVGNDIAGYIKKAGNLTEMLIRNAGHMVPSYQPKWSLEMIRKFVANKL